MPPPPHRRANAYFAATPALPCTHPVTPSADGALVKAYALLLDAPWDPEAWSNKGKGRHPSTIKNTRWDA